jgi:hypothetical protein
MPRASVRTTVKVRPLARTSERTANLRSVIGIRLLHLPGRNRRAIFDKVRESIVNHMAGHAEHELLSVAGREVAISNPGKVLFPQAGFITGVAAGRGP